MVTVTSSMFSQASVFTLRVRNLRAEAVLDLIEKALAWKLALLIAAADTV